MRYFTVRGTALETRPGGRPLVVPVERVVREDALWVSPEGVSIGGETIDVISVEDTTDVIVTNPAFKRLLSVVETQRQWAFNMGYEEDEFERQARGLIAAYIGEMSRPLGESDRNRLITEYHVRARGLMLQ